MTEVEFLLDTVKYYAENPKRRCSIEDDCTYSPETLGKQDISDGCAIGRQMTPENRKIADSVGRVNIYRIKREMSELLPDWMNQMSADFLSRVQNFHDRETNWGTKKGLSDTGKEKLLSIITIHNLDKEPFKDYLN